MFSIAQIDMEMRLSGCFHCVYAVETFVGQLQLVGKVENLFSWISFSYARFNFSLKMGLTSNYLRGIEKFNPRVHTGER